MKKILVLLILAFLATGTVPCTAGIISNYKAKTEQHKIYKKTLSNIKNVIEKQTKYANEHNLEAIKSFYSDNFVDSDGFNKEIFFKTLDETWEAYPDIYYTAEIKNIDFTDNYATVLVSETAVSSPVEQIGNFEAIGELYSKSSSVYHLEKKGDKWLISSEKIIAETSSLKFGDARYVNLELNAPKQTGPQKDYTVTLKVKAPKQFVIVASINKENIVYPETEPEELYRMLYDNVLERVFRSNKDNVNEYALASVGITYPEGINEQEGTTDMIGIAFVRTRINVIPENKFIVCGDKEDGQDR